MSIINCQLSILKFCQLAEQNFIYHLNPVSLALYVLAYIIYIIKEVAECVEYGVGLSTVFVGIGINQNPDATEDLAQPNQVLNAFSDFFNNINNVREDIEKSGHRIQVINKVLLRKLQRL